MVLIECCTYCLLSLGAVVMGSSQDDWKKAEAVAKIIARCPSQVTSLMEYYSVVCPQVCTPCMCVCTGVGPQQRVYTFTGLDYWTGTLDWTTGLIYFWFLHMLWLV